MTNITVKSHDEQLADAYSILASEAARTLYLQEQGEATNGIIQAEAPFTYSVRVQLSAILFGGSVHVRFAPRNEPTNIFGEFDGDFGGLGVGGGITFGTAYFHEDINGLWRQDTNFQANITLATTNINFFHRRSNRFIGSLVAGGLSAGGGIFGGSGIFRRYAN